MKLLLYLIQTLILCCGYYASTCQHTITGKVFDQQEEALSGATIVLLDGKDSTMLSFALTDDLGRFRLPDVKADSNILQVSYISFESYSQMLEAKGSNKNLDLGIIRLNESSELLKEVTIKAEHIPMGIRGDTISYNADAFKTRPNATVEELLKKLPGIEVERNGNIKAQGEDVDNVLVDGKEFFGGDPKMATKNLKAEAIDKVEVYDKQSEVAEFTGIDDGEEEKTINLQLKEDHKNGGFGSAELAGGTEDSYQTGLNYFRFSPRLQASAIIASNNINEETFSFQDQIEFMGGIAAAMSSGGINFANYQGLEDGLNESTSIGANFNYEISEKLSLRSYYLFNRIANNLTQRSTTESITENFRYSNTDSLFSDKSNMSHQLNTKLNYKLNPFTELVFQNNLNKKERQIDRTEQGEFFKSSQNLGSTRSMFNSETDSWGLDSKTWFKQRFKKKGRSVITSLTYKKDETDKFDFVDNLNAIGAQAFDVLQNQNYDNSLSQWSLDMKATEPLSNKLFLGLAYAYGRSEETPTRLFYDIENGQDVFNDVLSSEYEKLYLYQRAGFNLRRNVKSLKMNLALNAQFTELNGIINDSESSISKDFVNLLPSYSLEYEMKGGKSLNFSYATSIIAPTLDQLMPLPDNTRPNFNYVGNPDLDPQYDHRLGMGFHFFDNFNFTSLFINLNSTISSNRIVYRTDIDENLFQTVVPINTDKYSELSSYLSFSRPFRPLKLKYRIRARMRYSNYDSFINGLASDVQDKNANIRFSLSNRKTDHVLLEVGTSQDFNSRKYGLAPDFDQNYTNSSYFLLNEFYLPKGWTISSDIEYSNFTGSVFENTPDFYLWQASISKLLFGDRLEMKLSAHDILNQNIGYRRTGDIQSIREVEFVNLGRFFMLGLKYKIGEAKTEGGMRIEID